MYKVIKYFIDLQDNDYEYKKNDVYPRDGYIPSEERIDELSSKKNAQNAALIKEYSAESTDLAEENKESKKNKEDKTGK